MRPYHYRLRAVFWPLLTCALGLGTARMALAQVATHSETPTVESKREILSEADPTKPILWAVRNEYRDLKNGVWTDTTVLRHDRFAFRSLGFKRGAKGLVTRFEVPINVVHAANGTKAGLGDLYAQALVAPRISPRFAFSMGSGIVLPTATDSRLGAGKLTIAPLVVPLWYMAHRKRLTSLRIQHFVSIAGKADRADVNYTVADPLVGWAISRKAWMFANTEFKHDWVNRRGSAVSGVQIGHMIAENMGLWIKAEVPWGGGRQGSFNIKVGFFKFR